MTNERVVCVHRNWFEALGPFQGLAPCTPELRAKLCDPRFHFLIPKPQAEQDSTFKQLVVYAVLVDHDGRVFRYTRGKAGEEGRLHGNWSVGVGGHFSECDTSHPDAYLSALSRELLEEAGLDTDNFGLVDLLPKVLVNDEQTRVGSMHLGFVPVVPVGDIHPKCRSVQNPEWVTPEQLRADLGANRYESWSRMLVENMGRLL